MSSLLIVGGSTRAAAQSARRAGLDPICADMFADADLRQIARILPVIDYPGGLVEAVAEVPGDVPLMYTGALENHPRLLDRFSRDRRLLGNPADVVRRVRSPFQVQAVLQAAGLPALEVLPGHLPPAEGDWIWKPFAGAGGQGLARLGDALPQLPARGYWQRFQHGLACSALFHAEAGSSALIGVARQLIGLPHLRFGWAGAIAPWPVAPSTLGILAGIGRVLVECFGMIGLFGIDFVLDDDGRPWLVEVNPRYTATVELYEFAMRQPLLGGIALAVSPASGPPFFGKRVIYAPCDLVTPDLYEHVTGTIGFDPPLIADIPAPGQIIPRHQPVCTVFSTGETVDACLDGLRDHKRIGQAADPID